MATPVIKTNRFGVSRTLKSSAEYLERQREYRRRPEVIARNKEWQRTHSRDKNRSRLPFGVSSATYWRVVNGDRSDYQKKWHRSARFHRYGITDEQYADMLEAQGGKCAMPFCQRRPSKHALAIDHDHATGVVRGLLCPPCNVLVAHFDRNPDLVEQVRSYLTLRKSPASTPSPENTSGSLPPAA